MFLRCIFILSFSSVPTSKVPSTTILPGKNWILDMFPQCWICFQCSLLTCLSVLFGYSVPIRKELNHQKNVYWQLSTDVWNEIWRRKILGRQFHCSVSHTIKRRLSLGICIHTCPIIQVQSKFGICLEHACDKHMHMPRWKMCGKHRPENSWVTLLPCYGFCQDICFWRRDQKYLKLPD